jgi:hypothetical protein
VLCSLSFVLAPLSCNQRSTVGGEREDRYCTLSHQAFREREKGEEFVLRVAYYRTAETDRSLTLVDLRGVADFCQHIMPAGRKRSAAEMVAPPVLRESTSKRSNRRRQEEEGYSTYVRGFRSVLHHPMGLPLVRALHSNIRDAGDGGGGGDDGDGDDEFPLVKELFPDFFVADQGVGAAVAAPDDGGSAAADAGAEGGVAGAAAAPPPPKRWWRRLQRWWETPPTRPAGIDDIFNHCHNLWRRGYVRNEAALTSLLAETMRTELTECSVTVAGDAAPVPDPCTGGTTARMDILVSKRTDDESGADRPLLVVEVGLDHGRWWTKLDQGVQCLRGMKAFRKSEAALLAVVTVGPGDHPTARLGVFLATPTVVPDEEYESGVNEEHVDYRVSLLWHDETTGTGCVSNGFGRILRATGKLPGFIAASKAMFDRAAYKYLGPNCCLIQHNNTKVGCLPTRHETCP